METKSIFQSKTFWGAVVTGLSSMAMFFGLTISEVEQTSLISSLEALGVLVGTLLTIYGRATAKKKVV